ncbi:hypothetical protein HBB16_18020 [Pseudonocardia sp. MCCB 268]|nr:hypothetical protein [Pseudonocardia cytotoxica]
MTVFSGTSPPGSGSTGIPYTSVVTIRWLRTISRYFHRGTRPRARPCDRPAIITYRHRPPTRRSISTLVIVPRWRSTTVRPVRAWSSPTHLAPGSTEVPRDQDLVVGRQN